MSDTTQFEISRVHPTAARSAKTQTGLGWAGLNLPLVLDRTLGLVCVCGGCRTCFGDVATAARSRLVQRGQFFAPSLAGVAPGTDTCVSASFRPQIVGDYAYWC